MVLDGRLVYRVLEPELREYRLAPGCHGVVEPQVAHEVEPDGPVRFYVEFHRVEADPEAAEAGEG